METIRCKICGTELEPEAGAAVCVCGVCGARQILPGAEGDALREREQRAAEAAARRAAFRTPGQIVTFGSYPQRADCEACRASEERDPIEWVVLEARGSESLLLSRHALDCRPYHSGTDSVTWETCALRGWLNGEFLQTAFDSRERGAILTTTVDNSDAQCCGRWTTTGGNDTRDKVFLLSYAEAHRFFGLEDWHDAGSTDNVRPRAAATPYAVSRGAFVSGDWQTADGEPSCWWWLRLPGKFQDDGSVVREDGAMLYFNVSRHNGCVRPAILLDTASDIL